MYDECSSNFVWKDLVVFADSTTFVFKDKKVELKKQVDYVGL